MTVVDAQGHHHELGTVDVRFDDGVVIAYDTHLYPIGQFSLEEVEAWTPTT